MEYKIEIDGLAAAVAAALVQAKHRALLAAVRSVDGFEHAELAAARDGSWLDRRRVIDAGGQVVAEDHKAYLHAQKTAGTCVRHGSGCAAQISGSPRAV